MRQLLTLQPQALVLFPRRIRAISSHLHFCPLTVLGLLVLLLSISCARTQVGPAASEPAITKEEGKPDPAPKEEPSPIASKLLNPCLPEAKASLLHLEAELDRRLETRDTRCWTAVEIALAHALLEAADDLTGEVRARQLRLAGYRFRQAELRAKRYAFDDLAAAALMGRAEVAIKKGDRDAVLVHLSIASQYVGLHTASTGEASETFDSILLQRMIQLLSAWEHRGEHALFASALETASLMKAREAMRVFQQQGVGASMLARTASEDADRALRALRELSEVSRSTFGKDNRANLPQRNLMASTVLETSAAWAAAAPLLLGWLPAPMPDILTGLEAVFGPGEVLLDYTVGPDHGVLLAISERGAVARPLPGRKEIEEAVSDCRGGSCAAFDRVLLEPAATLLEGSRQILVAAHGPLHEGPFESRLEQRTIRVPSALGLTMLRLREWQVGPKAHPHAYLLVSGAIEPKAPTADSAEVGESPHQETTTPVSEEAAGAAELGAAGGEEMAAAGTVEPSASQPSPPSVRAPWDKNALAILWASLSSGSHLLEWVVPDEPRPLRYGAPLTVPPAPSEPEAEAPSEPEAEASSEPEAEASSEPEAEASSEPEAEQDDSH